MIFQLTWGTYDTEVQHYFEAPEGATEGQFKILCDRLMVEAAKDVLNGKYESPSNVADSWIGYDVLVHEVAARLGKYGYKKVTFSEVVYTHGMIIRVPGDGEILGEKLEAEVITYNKNLEEKLCKHRKK